MSMWPDKFASTCLAVLELWSLPPQLFLPHTLLLIVYQIVQRKHTAEQQQFVIVLNDDMLSEHHLCSEGAAIEYDESVHTVVTLGASIPDRYSGVPDSWNSKKLADN